MKGPRADLRKVVIYSIVILAMPFVGEGIGEALRIWRLLELIEAIPAIVCAFFVARLPKPVKPAMPVGVRLACLTPLLLLLMLGVGSLPVSELGFDRTTALVFSNAIAIGVTEELTFRYGLHRLWIQYGAGFYVVLSSLVFGIAHYSLGATAIGITAAIGAILGLARIAGLPVLVLIIIHGLIDSPEMMARFAAMSSI